MSEMIVKSAKPQKGGTEKKTPVSSRSRPDLSQSIDSPVNQILYLQRTIGNRAVNRLIQSGAIQAKLNISHPYGIHKKEADRLAEHITPLVQRQVDPEEKEKEPIQAKIPDTRTPEVTPYIESNINTMKGGGHPLPESSRAFFESRFGADFRHVRLHTDSRAADTAQSINAKAFTSGKDIVFNSGQYSPGTSSGNRLLAHELTHVVQQKNYVQREEKPIPTKEYFPVVVMKDEGLTPVMERVAKQNDARARYINPTEHEKLRSNIAKYNNVKPTLLQKGQIIFLPTYWFGKPEGGYKTNVSEDRFSAQISFEKLRTIIGKEAMTSFLATIKSALKAYRINVRYSPSGKTVYISGRNKEILNVLNKFNIDKPTPLTYRVGKKPYMRDLPKFTAETGKVFKSIPMLAKAAALGKYALKSGAWSGFFNVLVDVSYAVTLGNGDISFLWSGTYLIKTGTKAALGALVAFGVAAALASAPAWVPIVVGFALGLAVGVGVELLFEWYQSKKTK